MNIFAHNNHIIMNANMQIHLYNDRISVSNIKKNILDCKKKSWNERSEFEF